MIIKAGDGPSSRGCGHVNIRWVYRCEGIGLGRMVYFAILTAICEKHGGEHLYIHIFIYLVQGALLELGNFGYFVPTFL